MISATPFNFFTCSELQNDSILNWRSFISHQSDQTSPYQGLTELRNQQKIVVEDSRSIPGDQLGLQVNGFTPEFVQVVTNYITGLASFGRNKALAGEPRSTHEAIKKCVEEKKLIVIRLPNEKDDISRTRVAEESLKLWARKSGLEIEVMTNDSNTDCEFQFDEHRQRALANARNRDPEMTEEKLKKNLQFSDVKGIPMIMLVVGKGRMGDTFPPCVRFDLMSRYQDTKLDFTSVIQVCHSFFLVIDEGLRMLVFSPSKILKTIFVLNVHKQDQTRTGHGSDVL